MIKDGKSCSRLRARWAHRHRVKPEEMNARAVALSELDSASLHLDGKGEPARGGEAGIWTEDRLDARLGLPGVKGDSACGKNRRELGRAAAAAGALCNGELGLGINNQAGCCGWQSERPIVAMRRVTTVERRGRSWEQAESEATSADWRRPKTEEAAKAVEAIGSRARSWAARPSPAVQAGRMSGGRVVLDESRMREICTSGSTRGRAALVRVVII